MDPALLGQPSASNQNAARQLGGAGSYGYNPMLMSPNDARAMAGSAAPAYPGGFGFMGGGGNPTGTPSASTPSAGLPAVDGGVIGYGFGGPGASPPMAHTDITAQGGNPAALPPAPSLAFNPMTQSPNDAYVTSTGTNPVAGDPAARQRLISIMGGGNGFGGAALGRNWQWGGGTPYNYGYGRGQMGFGGGGY